MLSPSQAESYATCPRRYAIGRRLDAGGEAGPYADFGRLIHEVLERAETKAVAAGTEHSSLETALQELEAVFDQFDFARHGSADAWKQRAEGLLTALYEAWIRPGSVPVLLEKDLEMTIGGIRWRGRVDRIERDQSGELRIVDYKTTKTPVKAADAAVSVQLGFYLHAGRRDPAILAHGSPEQAEFWYPMSTRKQKWSAFDPARLTEVVGKMEEIGDSISAEDWRPQVGPHCENCDVRIVCPEWPEGSESFLR